jgi:hypothetical protein
VKQPRWAEYVLAGIKHAGSVWVLQCIKGGMSTNNAVSFVANELHRMFPFMNDRFVRIFGYPIPMGELEARIRASDARIKSREKRAAVVKYDPFINRVLAERRVWTEIEVEIECSRLQEIPMMNYLYAISYYADEKCTTRLGTKVGITKNPSMRMPSLREGVPRDYGVYMDTAEPQLIPVSTDRKLSESAEKLAHAYCIQKTGCMPQYGQEYFGNLSYGDAIIYITWASIGYITEDLPNYEHRPVKSNVGSR